jgi:hypothetical protein
VAYTQLTEADLALPISPLALRILLLLRIRCWSPDGPKGREITLADIQEAIGTGGVRTRKTKRGLEEQPRQGREAIAPALAELVQLGLVIATPRPGNNWRLLTSDAEVAPVPDEALPIRFRRESPEQKSAEPTSRNRQSRSQKSAEPTSRNRQSRSQKSAEPIAEIGRADRRNRQSRFLSDDVDQVDQVDQVDAAVDGCPSSHGTQAPSRPLTPREDLEELRRRHRQFLESLPEEPRPKRLRVAWLIGTPTELAQGLRRETEWVAEALFCGELEPARGVVHEVFEHAWRRAYDGDLSERWLARSLWGQAFRARVREWADAQHEHKGDSSGGPDAGRGGESGLSFEQLEELSAQATERLRGGAKSA